MTKDEEAILYQIHKHETEEAQKRMSRGFLVAVDGIDGSGKTTMANLIHDALYERFRDRVMKIQYPGATVLGTEIRKLVKSVKADLKINPVAERLLFCADNIQTLQDIIVPGLKEGKIIVSDRWSFITDWAYSIPNGMEAGTLQVIQSFAPKILPDLYIVLRCSYETSKARRGKKQPLAFGIDQRCRIEEQGDDFMMKACEQYSNDTSETMRRAQAMSRKVVIVDADEGILEAKKSAMDAIDRALMTLE